VTAQYRKQATIYTETQVLADHSISFFIELQLNRQRFRLYNRPHALAPCCNCWSLLFFFLMSGSSRASIGGCGDLRGLYWYGRLGSMKWLCTSLYICTGEWTWKSLESQGCSRPELNNRRWFNKLTESKITTDFIEFTHTVTLCYTDVHTLPDNGQNQVVCLSDITNRYDYDYFPR
jgi:hypothetical protein